jgi:surface antigen
VNLGKTRNILIAIAALVAGNTENCIDPSFSSYSCVAMTGYKGTAPYNVDRFSVLHNGFKHSCTSFAAYMLYNYNTHSSAITNFDSAQYWDQEASRVAGARVSSTPHLGDIAQWNAVSGSLPLGHVAFVIDVIKSSSGQVTEIITLDDNANRGVTTEKHLFPAAGGTISWPDNFITFPGSTFTGFGGGGGGGGFTGPRAMSQTNVTP